MKFKLVTLYAHDIEDQEELEVKIGQSTISDLKSQNLISRNRKYIVHGAGEIRDDYLLQQGAVVYSVLPNEEVFFIKTQQNEIHCFILNPNEKVSDLKARIANKPSGSIDGQILTFGGKVLEDDKDVRAYVTPYSTVTISEIRKKTECTSEREAILVDGDCEYMFKFISGVTTIAQAKQYIKSQYKVDKDFFQDAEKLDDNLVLQDWHQRMKFSSVETGQQPKIKSSNFNLKGCLSCIALSGLVSLGYYKCSSTSFGSKYLGEFSLKACLTIALVGTFLGCVYGAVRTESGQTR